MAKALPYSIENIRELSRRYSTTELLDRLDGALLNNPVEVRLAACVCSCREAFMIELFDEQIDAAYAIYQGRVVEMATGEGKTFAAAAAAFMLTQDGRRVHILTFNDYLAKRDCEWMKPVFTLLGVDSGVILESTPRSERGALYRKPVLYSTAREVGFDYLRDFVAYTEEGMEPFDCAIVDEADSTLIDAARIPLVIAGQLPAEPDEALPAADRFVKSLGKEDYALAKETESAYLTDLGVQKAERAFEVENLFDLENTALLSAVNDCLKAQYVLRENKDYILKNGEILLVDHYTGRVVVGQHYPGTLHSAVELKHGLTVTMRGTVMGTVPLQFFMREYPFIAGMTGTAAAAAEEFELLYGLELTVIPPHKPCRRQDHPLEVYYNKEIKERKILEEICRVHAKGQPVLVGTSGISESERLTGELHKRGVTAQTLNAKNDEMEAGIIKNAGALGAVTITTNMAGRGVDILLGGADRSTRKEVEDVGGLFVIASTLHESSRMNAQLSGRAGRQGDIGESKCFAALDDEIMTRFELKTLVPKRNYPEHTEEKITDSALLREIQRIQRISEGDTLDERKRMLKFTAISEKHRAAIFTSRRRYLTGESVPRFWQGHEAYGRVVERFGEAAVAGLEQEAILTVINEAWSEYLAFTSGVRSGIHLTSIAGKNPAEEFNMVSEEYYREMEQSVDELMAAYFDEIAGMDTLEAFSLPKPQDTWTYLLGESGDELVKKPFLLQALSAGADEEIKDEPAAEKKSFFKSLFQKKSK